MRQLQPHDNPSATTAGAFVFALGEHVRWAASGQVWAFVWQVLQQRLTITMVSQIREYLLIAVSDPLHAPVWVHEADLTRWERLP